MEVRAADAADVETVREIARRSMEASYTLSPQTIEGAVKQWYSDEAFAERIEDDDQLVLVAEEGGEPRAFSESVVLDEEGDADLNWLHVDPDYRGEGIASALFAETRERLEEMGGTRLHGRVLRDNTDGNQFYRHLGFQKVGEDHVDIDGTDYVENVYVEGEPTELEAVTTDDGKRVYVDHDDAFRASLGPFFTAFSDTDRETRWGYYCGNCGSLDIAVDTMDRVHCNECGNVSKASRWDAAYL
ncbi:GNAT family N-acetyltransferase [Halomarina pelagica]|uniref:GNAT family N-acetyltransferase n=1 Tax=Halomarina pelagica TaxID=2961599 RepID=UPI0020C1DA96|nr:GNAT family N-acetyltransferase [Halomarina sp. BND7]